MPTPSEIKRAQTAQPLQETIATRFSPYGFRPEALAPADLTAIFEAARWAPSCFGEQPARYMVATRDAPDDFERMLACLVDANRAWAQHAGAVALGVVSSTFARNGKENAYARHDLGLASAQLTLEAEARGLAVHQMAGILADVARETWGIPDGFDVVTALAIGHVDEASVDERDRTPRSRRPVEESVFTGTWGASADFL